MIYQKRDDIERLSKEELETLIAHWQKVLQTESRSFVEREHIKYDIYRMQTAVKKLS